MTLPTFYLGLTRKRIIVVFVQRVQRDDIDLNTCEVHRIGARKSGCLHIIAWAKE